MRRATPEDGCHVCGVWDCRGKGVSTRSHTPSAWPEWRTRTAHGCSAQRVPSPPMPSCLPGRGWRCCTARLTLAETPFLAACPLFVLRRVDHHLTPPCPSAPRRGSGRGGAVFTSRLLRR